MEMVEITEIFSKEEKYEHRRLQARTKAKPIWEKTRPWGILEHSDFEGKPSPILT